MQDFLRALPDNRFEFLQVPRADKALNGFPVLGMFRWVFLDEADEGEVFRHIAKERRRRIGKGLVILFDFKNIVEPGYRPEGSEHVVLHPVNRRFFTQALKKTVPDIVDVNVRIRNVDFIKRKS